MTTHRFRVILTAATIIAMGPMVRRPAEASCASGLCYYGNNAPVIVNPKVYLIEWGFGLPVSAKDPSNEVPTLENLYSSFGGWHWTGTDTQYFQTVNSV